MKVLKAPKPCIGAIATDRDSISSAPILINTSIKWANHSFCNGIRQPFSSAWY